MAIADEIENLSRRSLDALRDLLVHNTGVVNRVYLDKAGSKARFALGTLVVIDRPYFDESWSSTRTLVEEIASAALGRLP